MRKTSTYARKRKHCDPLAGLRLLDHSRPYEPGDMDEEHKLTRDAAIRLQIGTGSRNDFDRVAWALNVGVVRAHSIDLLLAEVIARGQDAVVRMKARYLKHLSFGYDAEALQSIPAALDACEAIANSSSPKQQMDALKTAYQAASGGHLLGGPQ